MNFCSELEDLTAVAKLQKILKNGKGATLGKLKNLMENTQTHKKRTSNYY